MEYYYGDEAQMFTFYRIPKILFTDPRYKSLSTDAKVLYGLMLDRMGLSLKNHKQDARGRTYIFFRQEEAAELLGIGKNKTTKLYRELEMADLIERKRQGLTHPDIIYVGRLTAIPTPSATESASSQSSFPHSEPHPGPLAASESRKTGFRNAEKRDSGTPKNGIQEADKSGFYLSNTEKNDIYKNESIYLPAAQTPDVENYVENPPPPPPLIEVKKMFKEYIDYDGLKHYQYPGDYSMDNVDELVTLMADEYSNPTPTIRAGGVERPRQEFRERLKLIDADNVLRILYKLDNRDPADPPIKNRRAYLITMLYNHASTDPTPEEEAYKWTAQNLLKRNQTPKEDTTP